MKKNILMLLFLIIALSIAETAFSETVDDNDYVKVINNEECKARRTKLGTAKIYFSISADEENEELYFPDFTIVLGKGDVPDLVVVKKSVITEKVRKSYSLEVAHYEAEPELACQTNFYGYKGLFYDIKKFNYFPDTKIIIGYGYSSFEEIPFEEALTKKRKRKYFIIIPLKNTIKVHCLESKEKFSAEAKKILKSEKIELKEVGTFFYENAQKAILANHLTPFENPWGVSVEIEKSYGITTKTKSQNSMDKK